MGIHAHIGASEQMALSPQLSRKFPFLLSLILLCQVGFCTGVISLLKKQKNKKALCKGPKMLRFICL